MMIHEFERMTGMQIAPECWERIEYVYMNCDQFETKDQIVDYYKKHDMNGIEKLYRELKEKKQEHYYALRITAGKIYRFEYKAKSIFHIINALNAAAHSFGFELDVNKAMEVLVEMEFKGGLSYNTNKWGVKKIKGELKGEEER